MQDSEAKKIPFRSATAERMSFVTTKSFSNSQDIEPIKISEVGYLSYLIVEVTATMTANNVTGLTSKGAHALLNRLTFEVNNGVSDIYDTSGFLNPQVANLYDYGFATKGGIVPANALYYVAPTANAANAWKLFYFIPISLNRHANFETGLIPMNARGLTGYLKIRAGAVADAVTLGGGTCTMSNATVSVYKGYFETADPSKVALPKFNVVRTLESEYDVTADNSELKVPLQNTGILTDLLHCLIVNNARQDYFDEVSLKLADSDTRQKWTKAAVRFMNDQVFGNSLGAGAWAFLLNNGFGGSIRESRDHIDTTQISLIESIVKVNTGGAGLGASNNRLHIVRRVIQPLKKSA